MPYLVLSQLWVPDDIIPAAWANQIGDNFTRVDARTGNEDPGVPGLLLVSNGVASAGWRLLGLGDFQNGTVPDAALVNPHVYRNNPIPLSPTFAGAGSYGSGFFTIPQEANAPVPGNVNPWLLIQDRIAGSADTRVQIACNSADVNELWVRTIIGGSPSLWRKIWHQGNGDFLTRVNPQTIIGNLIIQSSPGAITGYLSLGNDLGKYIGFDGAQFQLFGAGATIGGPLVLNGGLTLTGAVVIHSGDLQVHRAGAAAGSGYLILGNTTTNYLGFDAGSNTYQSSHGVLITASNIGLQTVANASHASDANTLQGNGPTAFATAGHTHSSGGGGTPVAHTHSGEAILPASINGAPTSAAPAAGAIPIADAAGKLASGWLPAAAGGSDVPVGLIALWNGPTAPTGWTFETSFNGRFPVAAGGSGGTVAAAFGTSGGAPSYDHSINIGHGHGNSFGGTVGADATSAVKVNQITPNDSNAAQSGHGHTFTPSGGVSGLGTTNATTGAINHLPPYYAINYVRKSP